MPCCKLLKFLKNSKVLTVIGIMLGIIFFLTVSEVIAHSLLIDRSARARGQVNKEECK